MADAAPLGGRLATRVLRRGCFCDPDEKPQGLVDRIRIGKGPCYIRRQFDGYLAGSLSSGPPGDNTQRMNVVFRSEVVVDRWARFLRHSFLAPGVSLSV